MRIEVRIRSHVCASGHMWSRCYVDCEVCVCVRVCACSFPFDICLLVLVSLLTGLSVVSLMAFLSKANSRIFERLVEEASEQQGVE